MTASVNTQNNTGAAATTAAPTAGTEKSTSTPPIPPFLVAVNQMVATMGKTMGLYIQQGEESTISTMAEANAATSQAIANLETVNSEMVQAEQQEEKEQTWGTIGSICGDVLGIALLPFDPALGLALLGGSAAGQLHITQDVVSWISDGIQDILPDLSSADCQALADITVIVAVVTAAIVLGVLTGGVADEAIADVAVDDVSKKAAKAVIGDVSEDVLADVSEDVMSDVTESVAEDVGANAAEDAGAAADPKGKKSSVANRAKRGVKFAEMLGAQALMQTDALPNIVKAIASNSSDPDAKKWQYLEAFAFAIELVMGVALSISGAMLTAPSSISMSASESTQRILGESVEKGAKWLGVSDGMAEKLGKKSAYVAANVPTYARNLALGAGIAQGASLAIESGYSAEVAQKEWEMSTQTQDIELYKLSTQIVGFEQQSVQKTTTKLEQELYSVNFAELGDGAATVADQIA